MAVTPADSTAAANEVFGRHPGLRALHARGTLLRGSFTAAPAAATLTRAGHLQGEPIPVTARVSNGSGNPNMPDYAPDVRGLAVKFYLPEGSRTDIVAQTAPRFPVHTPAAFLDMLRAQKPRPAMAWKLPLFLLQNPGTIARLPPNLAALVPPESYATCSYYAIHAYRFVDAGGGSRFVRYTWRPEAGERRLGLREAKRRGTRFLENEIRERVGRDSVRFVLELQIAEAGDNVDDPTSVWPRDRRRVNAGVLELTGLETERETGGDVLVFDPSRIVEGIELSADPVLRFRPAAYSDSVARRTAS
jgi:catalase